MRRFSIAVLAMSLPMTAAAQPVPTHAVREGDTLAAIAERYYGDPSRGEVIRRANNLRANAELVTGERLVVPMTTFHRVGPKQTWEDVAEKVYGQASRAFVIASANDLRLRAGPSEGTELRIPYPLKHVASGSESFNDISERYLGTRRYVQRIRRFNGLRSGRPARGQVVLVPLIDLKLTDEGFGTLTEALQSVAFGAEHKDAQQSASERLPELAKWVAEGSYAESVALGNRLLGTGELTSAQRVEIRKALAVAYIALDRSDMALRSFQRALKAQPSLELDSITTSPKVLKVFDKARAAIKGATK